MSNDWKDVENDIQHQTNNTELENKMGSKQNDMVI